MSNPPARPSYAFNETASNRPPVQDNGLTFAIRTDAAFATAKLKAHIIDHIRNTPDHPLFDKEDLPCYVTKIVHGAYKLWNEEILTAKAECLDYERYNLKRPEDKALHVHLHNAHALTEKAIELAEKMVAENPAFDNDLPVMFISLDDMIQKQREHWADIGFSRLFDQEGKTHFGYIGRPGMRPLEDQIEEAKAKIAVLSEQYGRKIPVVFLEDNVRQAKMMNWITGLLDTHGFFEHAELAAIATCFCCADEQERQAVQKDGRTIPLAIVIDYEANLVDVFTPRDLLLDGFAVNVNNNVTRLPGIFMDVAARFKIQPEKTEDFKKMVLEANIAFCKTLETAFDVDLPIAWFKGADAISHISETPAHSRMANLLNTLWEKIADTLTGKDPAAIADKNGPKVL